MRSNKVTVSKPYSELSRHGKERFRVVVQTPSGKKSIVFNTLGEATRRRQRLKKLHRQDFEKPEAELIEEYQTHCVTERQYRPRTAHVERRRLSGIFLQKADMRLSRLTRAKAEALTQALWVRGNQKSGAERLAVATNRIDGRLLGRFGEWACKAKYIPENPFVGLMPTGKANVGKVHLTTDERVKWLHRAVQRICKAAGVTMICTHSLRGMNAELQLEGGIAEDVVAKSLGHTFILITKSLYVSRDTQDAIAAKKFDISIIKYSDINLLPAHSADAESVLAQLGPEVAAALRTLLATAWAAA